jgi:hypothetical protein
MVLLNTEDLKVGLFRLEFLEEFSNWGRSNMFSRMHPPLLLLGEDISRTEVARVLPSGTLFFLSPVKGRSLERDLSYRNETSSCALRLVFGRMYRLSILDLLRETV